mgnify:CR=1 FL=1
MLKKIRPFIFHLFILTIIIALSSVIDIYINLQVKEIIDLTTSGNMEIFASKAITILVLILILLPTLIIINGLRSSFIKKAVLRMKNNYIKRVFDKNINEFRNENNSLYLSALTNDYEQIERNYLEPIIDIINSFINLAASIILFSIISPWILLIAFGLMTINIIVSLFSAKPLNKHNKQRSKLFEEYTSYVKEVLSAFHIIKTNDLEDKVKQDFYQKSHLVQEKGYTIDKISSFVFAIQNANFTITFITLFLIVGYMGITGVITFGTVVLIINSLDRLVWPVVNLSESLPKMFSVKSIFKRIDETLTNQDDYLETKNFAGLEKEIILKNVSFSYHENRVIEDVNMRFEKGKKYLIIGPSGGGKSTVLRLLRKYFNPQNGEILIDGIPLKDIKKEQYFNHIANIEQNVFLFEDSIRNNLTLYKEYHEEEINAAIERAGLTDFIASLPQGLDTIIYDNGKNISGGERSRIAIARGLINKAEIIFLDEAFASLDSEKAKAIEKSLLDLKDVTIINVSHVVFKEHQEDYDGVWVVKNKGAYAK